MSEKRKNDTIIEGEYYDPDLPAQENTPPQKHRRTRSAGNVPKYNPASESIITKSNDLIQKTKYALPKLEQKVLLAMMAQINPKETPDADRVYSLSFSDFGRLAGVNMHDNTYLEYLKDTVKSLEDRSFWSLDPASDGHQYKVLSWLQRGSTVNDRDKQISPGKPGRETIRKKDKEKEGRGRAKGEKRWRQFRKRASPSLENRKRTKRCGGANGGFTDGRKVRDSR